MIPHHVQEELSKLSDAQKSKFQQLLIWAGSSGLPGVGIPVHTYENLLKMVKQMGEDPINPVEPNKSVNHDWEFQPKTKRS